MEAVHSDLILSLSILEFYHTGNVLLVPSVSSSLGFHYVQSDVMQDPPKSFFTNSYLPSYVQQCYSKACVGPTRPGVQ